MGTMINNQTEVVSDIAIVNPQDDFRSIYELAEDMSLLNIKAIELSEVDLYREKIDNEEWTMVIVFPENLSEYDGTGDKPVVQVYSNPNRLESSNINNRFLNYLIAYQETLSYNLHGDTTYFYINQGQTELDENQLMGTVLSQLMPMLIIMFLFSGAMSIGPEAIAGEKERGTIATILITPIKRRELAMGKILSLSVLSLLSAVSSFLGIILSLPKLINQADANMAIYGFNDYLLIFLVLFSTIFVIIGIISILSAFAKSVKEAGSYITPVYILTILVSITSSFGSNQDPSIYRFLLPILNSVESLRAIMTFSPDALVFTLVTVAANIVYLTIFVAVLNKMFNSEKIMFAK
ncbi:MAG TPA: ABC transporter permease, partial [Bacillota bacterium]|nr:ABC transporter permease [Bacillota bacterium]